MTSDYSTVRCPICKTLQRYMADEWPDDCSCGYVFEREGEEEDADSKR